jgi:uncharacterized protein YcbK (DUF882 family)
MYEAKYFTIGEFDSPDLPNSGINMDNEFLKLLDKARDTAGIPFKITSGYRTSEYNKSLQDKGYKASPNSSHLRGYAADIACTSGTDRWTIIDSLIKAGFNRIGVAKTFIHVDNDPDKSSAIWTY